MDHLFHLVRDRCVANPWQLIALVLGNLWIACAYLWIPRVLRRIASTVPRSAPGLREVRGFALFVGSCGITHLFTIVVLFFPGLDWTAIAWMLWTGFISWLVARRLAQAKAAIISTAHDADRLQRSLNGGHL